MMNRVFFIILLLQPISSRAQIALDTKYKMDSMLVYAQDEKHPLESRMRAYHGATNIAIYGEPQLGIQLAFSYLEAAQKNEDPLRAIFAYHFIGTGYLLAGELEEALIYHERGLELSRAQKDFSREAEALADLGIVYSAKGELETSLKYQKKCLNVSKQHDLKVSWARALINIGEIQELRGDYKASLSSFEEALELCLTHNYTGFYPAIYAKLGDVNLTIKEYATAEKYFQLSKKWSIKVSNTGKHIQALEKLGQLDQELNQDEKALQHYSDAIQLAVGGKLHVHLARIKYRIASIETKRNELAKARTNIEESIHLFQQNKAIGDLDNAYILSGEIYYKEGDLVKSKIHLEKGYELAQKSNDMKALLAGRYYLYQLHKKLGNNTLSLHYYEQYNQLKDLKRDDEEVKKLLKMELNREYRDHQITDSINKAREIEALENKHHRDKERQENKAIAAYTGLGILSLLLAIAGYLFVQKRKNNRMLKEKNEVIEKALKDKGILLKEVHHRVKNNMQVVSSLLHLKSKSTSDLGAKEALLDSQLRIKSMEIAHQKMYQNDNYDEINITDYCQEILSLLIDRRTKSQGIFEVQGEALFIDVEKAQAIGFIIYELITNSLKYAWDDAAKKSIVIQITSDLGNVQLQYNDNGKGLPLGFKPELAKSFGLKMINSMVQRQIMGTLETESNNGAQFIIRFKKDNEA